MLDYKSFTVALLEAVPELEPVYKAHIDNNDEVLEHVFMGDVTRFAEQIYAGDPESECLARLLKFLDDAFATGDEMVQELVSVSFLENLSRDQESYEGIRDRLSESLARELSNYE